MDSFGHDHITITPNNQTTRFMPTTKYWASTEELLIEKGIVSASEIQYAMENAKPPRQRMVRKWLPEHGWIRNIKHCLWMQTQPLGVWDRTTHDTLSCAEIRRRFTMWFVRFARVTRVIC